MTGDGGSGMFHANIRPREKTFGELCQLEMPKFLEHLGIGFYKEKSRISNMLANSCIRLYHLNLAKIIALK